MKNDQARHAVWPIKTTDIQYNYHTISNNYVMKTKNEDSFVRSIVFCFAIVSGLIISTGIVVGYCPCPYL